MSDLVWPETTTHGCSSHWSGSEHAGEWRDDRRGPDDALLADFWAELERTDLPGVKLEGKFDRLTGGPGFPGRHCWYCGSIHPGDLYDLLAGPETVKVGGSDWKYGWPHKFYVETPNPRTDGLYVSSSSAGGPCSVCRPPLAGEDDSSAFFRARLDRPADPACVWCLGKGSNPSHVPKTVTPYAYPTLNGKFYNEHLEELEEPAFAALTDKLAHATGVRFTRSADGKLMYAAPYRGYQA